MRASRAGHTFHERWAARRALQLVFPPDRLEAIAVKGLSTNETIKPGAAAGGFDPSAKVKGWTLSNMRLISPASISLRPVEISQLGQARGGVGAGTVLNLNIRDQL
ncbi:hypothetical protein [Bradyrhizobium sp. SZCCHNRI1073]|uniref:hypothetical protein n=1 Tax=Bradyrhizobium sp. SZCCHNRI1073 TaxID=3057280 RepID=UPI0029162373|nr:hypothetical protein [Bradyrhizobium sp. SZCCHNRI1073]